ncbi:autotransporter outer membrane beta-barrel domain-containing protein [Litorivivens sp.]|uniref:autotransporter outer membrane beta-barrel domain-containing protein n=1 Tax=Litorivivens sp. TaxID=2020868 RepID=UPI00356B3CE3
MTRLGQTLLIRLAAASLCLSSLAFADHQGNLVNVHDDNITLIGELVTISFGFQDQNKNADRCDQSDCPGEGGFSASGAAGSFASSLGSRIGLARGRNSNSARGGSAGADTDGFSRWSPFLMADSADTDKQQTRRGLAYAQDSEALLLGVDYQLHPDVRGGISLSSLKADTVIAGKEGDASSDTLMLGFHGSKYWGDTFLDTLASVGQIDLDSVRHSSTGSYRGATQGKFHSAEAALGHFFGWQGLTLTPSLRIFHLRGKLDDYSEQPLTGSGALSYRDLHFESLNLRGALQLDYAVSTNFGVVIPGLYIAYHREFGDVEALKTRSGIKHISDKPEQNYGSARLSLSLQLRHGRSVFAAFEKVIAHSLLDQKSFTAGLRLEL